MSLESSKQKIKTLDALVEASQLLNSSLDLEKILSILLDIATKNLNAARGTIYLIDKEKNELWSHAVKGDEKIEIRLPIGKGIAGYVAETGKTVNLKDVYKDKRFNNKIDAESGFKTKTMLCAPMKNKKRRIVGVFQLLNKKKGTFNNKDRDFLAAISIPASLAIENTRLHLAEIENQRMAKELEMAAQIQKQLLPQELPKIEKTQLQAITIPCFRVGGDFYDVIKIDRNKLALAVADVAGKGIPGALLVSTLQAALHIYLELDLSLTELVSRLNDVVCRNSTPEKFITFFLCIYDLSAGKLEYVNAGHSYPLVINRDNQIVELKKGGLCLGLLPALEYESGIISMKHNDLLLLYTDGVTEAINRKREFYTEEKLYSLLRSLNRDDIDAVHNSILNDVKAFSDNEPLADDLTLVMMKID